MPSELETLLASVNTAANDLVGRAARIQIDGSINKVSAEGGVTTITVGTPDGGQWVVNAEHVQLLG